jgi:hypothetical protein
MKSYKLNDQFPVGFELNSKTWTISDTANTTSGTVLNDGTSDVKTTASCAGSDGLAPLIGARIQSHIEALVYAAFDESAEAEGTYATALKDNATLITEVAENLQDIFDTMVFQSNIDRS